MKKLYLYSVFLFSSCFISFCQAATNYKEFAQSILNRGGIKSAAQLLEEFDTQKELFQDDVDCPCQLNSSQERTCLEILAFHFKNECFPGGKKKFKTEDFSALTELAVKLLKGKPKKLAGPLQYFIQSSECTIALIKAFEDAGLNIDTTPTFVDGVDTHDAERMHASFALAALHAKGVYRESITSDVIHYLIDKSSQATLEKTAPWCYQAGTLGAMFNAMGNDTNLVKKLLYTKKVTINKGDFLNFFKSPKINLIQHSSHETLTKLIYRIESDAFFDALIETGDGSIDTDDLSIIFENLERLIFYQKFTPIMPKLEAYFKDKLHATPRDKTNSQTKETKAAQKRANALWGFLSQDACMKKTVEKAIETYKTEKEGNQESESLKVDAPQKVLTTKPEKSNTLHTLPPDHQLPSPKKPPQAAQGLPVSTILPLSQPHSTSTNNTQDDVAVDDKKGTSGVLTAFTVLLGLGSFIFFLKKLHELCEKPEHHNEKLSSPQELLPPPATAF